MPTSSFSRISFGALFALVLCALMGGNARADNVKRLIDQLRGSSDSKVRVSAVLALSKLRDERAIPAFVQALRDRDKTVRGVAAASLGKTVSSSTPASTRKSVLAALSETAKSDSSSFVKQQAKKAYGIVEKISSAPTKGGIFVDVGTMSAKVASGDTVRAHMRSVVQKTLAKRASSMLTSWPGGRSPSRKQLDAKKFKGFHVDGTIMELSARESGSTTTVTCKVSMLIASYPEKSMFGFLKGGAQVQGSSAPKEVQYAKEDCVSAVVEDLVTRKIIPTIEARP